MIDRLQSELAEPTPGTDAGRPNESDAARFSELMDAPPAGGAEGAASPTVAAAGAPQAAAPATASEAVPSIGDRILANMSSAPAQSPQGARPVDVSDPAELIRVQAEVAEIKTNTAIAVGAVQKTSQGVDTLLKTQ